MQGVDRDSRSDRKKKNLPVSEPVSGTRLFTPQLLYFHLIQFGGFFAIFYCVLISKTEAGWWMLAAISYFCSSCLGMAITFHRSLAHRMFVLPKALEYLFSWFGAMGGTGSTVGWIAVHRKHHAHPDSDQDPHAPARFGWRLLFSGYEQHYDWNRVRDILRDPFHAFLHRYYGLLVLSWAAALFAIHPKAFLFGFLIPACAQITVTNLSTILGHGWGYRNFEVRDLSTNNAFIAALTWGEGWHNNHHANPRQWKFGLKWWEIDPAGWLIALLAATRIIKRKSFVQN